MAQKIPQEALLKAAVQLFTTMPKNLLDRMDSTPLDEKYDNYVDSFVKFYRRLHDKLSKDEE